MDVRNNQEGIQEAKQEIQEGADALIIKPGLYGLDLLARLKDQVEVPLLSYHVSGEYAMLKTASEKGFLSFEKGLWESLMVLKRGGASGIITYGAQEMARLLEQMK